ncbi:MAG: M1 family metallopeptidase [Patescibacteria group bacterium]
MKKKATNVRLEKHVIPQRYSIHLAPDLDNFIFDGEEEIVLEITKEINSMILHCAEIEILKAEFIRGRKVLPAKVSYDPKMETVRFDFAQNLSEGKGVLKISFTGILNDKMRGFYRSKYEIDGKIHHMAVTQFESTDARRAFPCFDEPAHKAIFDVTLKIPSDRTAISNTIEETVLEHEGGYKIVKFAPSPKMSSYLLAFIVGHFEYIERKTEEGVLVRVFVTPGKKKQAEFALDVAVKTLSFYSKYFKIPYPLPVLDMIAIPDFAAGAMENWGAVTYRETAILVDEEHTSTHNKQWVALVIAHELAHQWFGNLVTMEWWTHLWLNEGFASYIEYLAVDNIFPKWNVWTQFVFMDHSRALLLDGLLNTHAVEVPVNHPAEISEIFDAVSYSKGATIIRMLAEYLGEKDFRDGLSHYLKKHSYSNASTTDLWDALSKVSGKPVGKIMENWIRKPGYPLIKLNIKNKKLKISQERFFSSPLIKQRDKTLWMIPVSLITSERKKQEYLLLKDEKKIISSKTNNWIKFNSGEKSLIRVSYPPNYLAKLEKPIKNKTLSEEDRFGIVRDVFALSQAGKMSTADALRISSSYKNDDSYIVWMEIASDLLQLSKLLYGQSYYPEFNKYMAGILKNIVKKIGWSRKASESHAITLMRGVLIYAMGTAGDKETITKAKKVFSGVLKNEKIDPDLRATAYRLVAENGGISDYSKLEKLYKDTSLQEEKDRVLRALCSFRDDILLGKALRLSLSEGARSQDLLKAISAVWANPWGRYVAWDFLKSQWKEIAKRFEGGHLFARFIQPAENFVTEKDAKDVEEFFKKNPALGIERTIAQALEQIRSNAIWLKRDGEKIAKFLKERS